MTKSFNIVTIKWGTMYGADDVNKLYAAILRNTSYRVRFYCFTDNTEGLNENILVYPIPKLLVPQQFVFGNHRKASGLCDDNLADLHGQRVFFFDLDSLIVGNLDELFEYPVGDRFYAINGQIHVPKKAVLIMTYADTSAKEAQPIISHYETLLNYLGWSDAGKVIASGVWTEGDVNHTQYPKQAYELGKNI